MQIKKMKKSAEICQEQKIGIRNRFKGNRYKNVKERKSQNSNFLYNIKMGEKALTFDNIVDNKKNFMLLNKQLLLI